MDCLFCKIIEGSIPSEKVYEDEMMLCFKDINPTCPVHVLMVPKKHIASLDELTSDDNEVIAHMMLKVKDIAKTMGLDNGYRLVINTGEDGQQSVKHLHMHLIGGRKLNWPAG